MFDLRPHVPQATAEDVKKAIDEKQDIVILDVRTSQEVARGKIAGSLHLPMDEADEKLPTVVANKDQKVYVYCLSGSRSVFVVEAMLKAGYTNVFNLTSGLLAWRMKQYPLVA